MTPIFIREPPPRRLDVGVTTTDGRYARWALDDPNPANQPQSLTFSDALPGGFEDFSCSLGRDPRRRYADTAELSDVKVRGPGGRIFWEGRLQQTPEQGGTTSSLSPAAVGYQAHLDDRAGACMIYVDAQLGSWVDQPLQRQQAHLTAGNQLGSQSTGTDSAGNPRLILEVDTAFTQANSPRAEAWYLAGVAGTIAKVYYSLTLGPNVSDETPWHEDVVITSGPAGASASAQTGNLIGTTKSGYLTAATPTAWAYARHYFDGNVATDGITYQTYWQLAAYGNHGLPLYGTDPKGVLASDVIAHALSTWAPQIGYTTGPNGTIQASNFVIPQLVFNDPSGTSSAIIKQVVGYEMLDWAVWEGPLFYLNPYGQSANAKTWVTRVKPAQLQSTGPDITRIWNGVIVSYTAADGTAQSVGPPGSGCTTEDASLLDNDPDNPANQVTIGGTPIPRWGPLSLGTSTLTGALKAGQSYLQEQKYDNTAGQATIVGPIADQNGILHHPAEIRSGDSLIVLDAQDTSPRRIVNKSYSHDGWSVTLQLDSPPDTEAAMTQRWSVALGPLGLS